MGKKKGKNAPTGGQNLPSEGPGTSRGGAGIPGPRGDAPPVTQQTQPRGGQPPVRGPGPPGLSQRHAGPQAFPQGGAGPPGFPQGGPPSLQQGAAPRSAWGRGTRAPQPASFGPPPGMQQTATGLPIIQTPTPQGVVTGPQPRGGPQHFRGLRPQQPTESSLSVDVEKLSIQGGGDGSERMSQEPKGRGRGSEERQPGPSSQSSGDTPVGMPQKGRGRGKYVDDSRKDNLEKMQPGPSTQQQSKPPETQQQQSRSPQTQQQQSRAPSIPSEVPSPRSSISQSSSRSSPATATSSSLMIPHRKKLGPMIGTKGRKILIEVNHLRLELKKTNAIAMHYDVDIKPDMPKKLFRPAMDLFRKKHYPTRYPAFDGRKNLYSCGFLPFTNEIHDTIAVFDNERQRDKEFKITIKLASQVDMSALSTYSQNGGRTIPQDAIQALDIVLRNPASMSFTQVGRSFFTPPKGQVLDLGDGMELWYGFYQSAILGWKPYLNIDVAHKGFPSPKYLIEIAMDMRRSQDVRDLKNPFDRNEASMFEKSVKNLKVEYELPNQPNSRRTYKVIRLEKPAIEARFTLENGSSMTVGEYFAKEKKIPLKFPSMPCVHVGNEKKNIYLPIEFCKIQAGQVLNAKLNEIQTANMVRAAAKPADVRKQRIMDAMKQANFNADKCINEFGITVSQEFTKVGARILDPPKLEYQNNQTVLPNKGVWRPMRFLKTNTLSQWCILNLDFRTKEQDCWRFGDIMISTGSQLGITIEKPYDVKTLNLRGPDKRPIIDYFDKNKSAQLIVVIFNDRDAGMYGKVKQCAELSVGVLTQCIKSKTMFKMNPATASNILLKVNSKLNGVNHQIDRSCRPRLFNSPIMIVGADVTHPSPDQKTIPSVAAVAASHDPAAFQYNMLWRLQQPRQEMIEDLEEMMKTQLKFFYQKTKQKPLKIIFYRDGVSEGQFSQVLDIELKAIRRACTSLQSDFNPKITFLVVQKRHHTRFFPTNPRDEDGKNKNVPAGTIVDTEITHPREMDFYLVSHASLQGTSRPTKYHKLWDDNDIDEDDLEELTYYLCHLFSRCTRSVSYPAPTYYAHLAAFRARCYIEGSQIQIGNLQREQETRMIQTAIVQNSPMFFV